jgi:antitoxin component YwqK of YwqJK toxin-antitoxin module
MKKHLSLFLCAATLLSVTGCNDTKKEENVVSQRYIHKYGYAVSKEDWESKNYPGQVVTTLRNGVTETSTFENGVLHGPSTQTFPHSQTIASYFVYSQGNLVKEMSYDIKGMPISEKVHFSPTRYSLTLWYSEGSPLSVEEYMKDELLEGQYFNQKNETESRVEKGKGLRVARNQQGTLLSKDLIEGGYAVTRESFFANGTPESVTHYAKGLLHGEKKTFAPNGEPKVVEEYIAGKLHGKCTYFNNGRKEVEISYMNGLRNGLEIHYIDGAKTLEETLWENDKKHGPSAFYVEGDPQTTWFYDGKKVSKQRYDELVRLDDMIARISPDVQIQGLR